MIFSLVRQEYVVVPWGKLSCVLPSGNFARELAGSAIAVRFILTAESRSHSRTGRKVMAAERGLPTSCGQ